MQLMVLVLIVFVILVSISTLIRQRRRRKKDLDSSTAQLTYQRRLRRNDTTKKSDSASGLPPGIRHGNPRDYREK